MEQYRSGHNGHDWKSCVPQKGTEGSNPSCSAKTPFPCVDDSSAHGKDVFQKSEGDTTCARASSAPPSPPCADANGQPRLSLTTRRARPFSEPHRHSPRSSTGLWLPHWCCRRMRCVTANYYIDYMDTDCVMTQTSTRKIFIDKSFCLC